MQFFVSALNKIIVQYLNQQILLAKNRLTLILTKEAIIDTFRLATPPTALRTRPSKRPPPIPTAPKLLTTLRPGTTTSSNYLVPEFRDLLVESSKV